MASSLDFIRITNLRSIVMTEDIELKPITILIGKNSAGKSTFARSFPLIRQSCEAKKRAPILWFGDRVDFGSFDESLRRNETGDKEISISFGLTIDNDAPTRQNRPIRPDNIDRAPYKAKIELGVVKASNRPSQASKITLDALGFLTTIHFDAEGSVKSIKSGTCEWKPSNGEIAEADYQSILPKIVFFESPRSQNEKKMATT